MESKVEEEGTLFDASELWTTIVHIEEIYRRWLFLDGYVVILKATDLYVFIRFGTLSICSERIL